MICYGMTDSELRIQHWSDPEVPFRMIVLPQFAVRQWNDGRNRLCADLSEVRKAAEEMKARH